MAYNSQIINPTKRKNPKRPLKQTKISQKLIYKMKALEKFRGHIASLEIVLKKMTLILSQSEESQTDFHRLKNNILTDLGFIIQNYIEYCQTEYLTRINSKIQEFQLQTGHKVNLEVKPPCGSVSKNFAFGQNLKEEINIDFLFDPKQILIGPILMPNQRQNLNKSVESYCKHDQFKNRQSDRSFQHSHESFYTAIDSQKFRIQRNFSSNSVGQDNIKKLMRQEALEKFQSIDEQSMLQYQAKWVEKQIQTKKRNLMIHRTLEQKIAVKKKDNKAKDSKKPSRDSTEVEQALLEIIYGANLFPFIKFYLHSIKQNVIFSASKQSRISFESQEFSSRFDSPQNLNEQSFDERQVLSSISQNKENQLIKYLRKGNQIQDITIYKVTEAKFQRLSLVCFDALLHTMKTIALFLPPGELIEIINEIKRQELNTLKKDSYESQEKDIERICKKVKKLMRTYRNQMKEKDENLFNKTAEIKALLV